MPGNPDELRAALESENQQTSAARMGGLAANIPTAREPLPAAEVRSAYQTISRGMSKVSGGQLPELPPLQVQGQLERVPPELGAAVQVVASFISQQAQQFPALERYGFDPISAMQSVDGLREVASIVDAMSRDEELQSQLTGSAPPPSEQESLEYEGGEGV